MKSRIGRPRNDEQVYSEDVVVRLLGLSDPVSTIRISPMTAVEAIRRMVDRGYTDGQMAHILNYTVRSVLRVRKRHGIETAYPVGSGKQHFKRVNHIPSKKGAGR